MPFFKPFRPWCFDKDDYVSTKVCDFGLHFGDKSSRVDVVVMRQLLIYCCNSTREPLLELKFPVCIASSDSSLCSFNF